MSAVIYIAEEDQYIAWAPEFSGALGSGAGSTVRWPTRAPFILFLLCQKLPMEKGHVQSAPK